MIRTILFDMGNVLVHFSHQRMCKQMAEVCGIDADAMRRRLFDTGLQDDFERGRLTPDAFHRSVVGDTADSVDRDRLRIAASDIFTLNDSMPELLDELGRLDIRLVLLSNTSVWHFEWVEEEYDLLDRFDDFTTSFAAGAIKPEPGIFESALQKIDCPPAECFYTDDIADYIAAGRDVGLQAEVFTETAALRKQLVARGVDVG